MHIITTPMSTFLVQSDSLHSSSALSCSPLPSPWPFHCCCCPLHCCCPLCWSCCCPAAPAAVACGLCGLCALHAQTQHIQPHQFLLAPFHLCQLTGPEGSTCSSSVAGFKNTVTESCLGGIFARTPSCETKFSYFPCCVLSCVWSSNRK